MTKKCPQTLDRPILLAGLEIEDLGALALIVGLGSVLFGPVVPGILGIIGWFILMEFKKDKPTGYMIHWLYHQGIDFPGLMPPIKKVSRYSVYAKSDFVKIFSLY